MRIKISIILSTGRRKGPGTVKLMLSLLLIEFDVSSPTTGLPHKMSIMLSVKYLKLQVVVTDS